MAHEEGTTQPDDAGPVERPVRPLVERLRDKSGGHINGLYDDEAAAEIERLAREAWTWSKACEGACRQNEALREVLQRCIAGIDHLSAIARLWEPDYSSGPDRRGWALANDARDDARKLLQPQVCTWPACGCQRAEADACARGFVVQAV